MSKTQQIYNAVRDGITSGEYPAGGRLPRVRWWGNHYDASLSVVNHAFDLLEQDGVIERRPRSGVFVRKPETGASLPSTDGWEGVSQRMVLVCVPTTDGEVHNKLLCHLCTELSRNGYSAVVLDMRMLATPRPSPMLQRHLNHLLAQGFHSAIAVGTDYWKNPFLKEFPQERIVMCLNLDYPTVPGSAVLVDYESGFHALTCHLLERGYHRIAFAMPRPGQDGQVTRLHHYSMMRSGYENALREHGLAGQQRYLEALDGLPDEQEAVSALSLIMFAPDPPDAIMTYTDSQAEYILDAAQNLGLQVPEQLAVTSFFDTAGALRQGRRRITTARVGLAELARKTVALAIAPPENSQILFLRPEILPGLTTPRKNPVMTQDTNSQRFYIGALDIADRKLFRDPAPTRLHSPRLGTGGLFRDIFLWDTAFCTMWARYHTDRFPVEASLDNFYLCQAESGFISRQITPEGVSRWREGSTLGFAPPLLSWAEWELSPFVPGRLARVYGPLCRLHEFNWTHFRRDDGLFYSDAYGSGMDNLPRWDDRSQVTQEGGIPFRRSDIVDRGSQGDERFRAMSTQREMDFSWNRQLGWCDTTCQVAFDALNLARIARALGCKEDARRYEARHHELAELVNRLCFNPSTGIYADRLGNAPLNRKTICGFWPLLSEIATKEHAEALFAHLENPDTFGRPHGIPALAADQPEYHPEDGYANGPAWPHTNYMVIKGVQKYGRDALARKLAHRLYDAAEKLFFKTGTIWENYSPEQDEKPTSISGQDFCGWSALIPICFKREFLNP